MEFYKLHGLGNDYIYVDCVTQQQDVASIVASVTELSDRRFGIGSDGVILLLPSDKADVRMRMFNCHDGSEAEMCGNGVRCVFKLANELGIVGDTGTVETIPGIVHGAMAENDMVSVRLFSKPNILEINKAVTSTDKEFTFYNVNVGNPHAVINISGVADFDVEKYGKPIEKNLDLFPERTNVEFYEELSRGVVSMRVWERGSGETFACGTGACATAATYRDSLNNEIDEVTVKMLGGDLHLTWTEDGFYMKGGATLVFKGEVALNNEIKFNLREVA